MNAQEIIELISTAEKKTPVRMYVKENAPIDYGSAKVFGVSDKIVFGDWNELEEIVKRSSDRIEDIPAHLRGEFARGDYAGLVRGKRIRFWIDSEQVEVDEADLTGAAPSGGAASLKKALGK